MRQLSLNRWSNMNLNFKYNDFTFMNILTNLIPWSPGPHVTWLMFTNFDPPLIATQSSPIKI
jgi:hypothetical protein